MAEGAATRTDGAPTGCRLSELFRLLGERHVPDILHLLLQHESIRFTAIQDRLKMSPNTLSERLRKLTAAGLAHRQAYQEIPPRVEYSATLKARDLEPVFEGLDAWARTHALRAETAPGEAAEAAA